MSTTVELTQGDDGRRVDLPAGGTLAVRLSGQPGTGFSWQVDNRPANLTLVGEDTEGGGAAAGAASVQVFRFRADGPGGGGLELAYRRVWEKAKPPAARFRVAVSVAG